VVDEDGNEVVSSPVPSSLQFYYDEHLKREQQEQNYETLNAELIELMEAVASLRYSDLPVAEVEAALHAARDAVDNMAGYWKKTTFGQARAALARVRRLIAELEGSFVTVAVRGLMSGDIYHRHRLSNEQLRQRQLSLWIRLGGSTPLQEYFGYEVIDLLTDDRLAAIYTEMLLDASVKTLSDVDRLDLALDVDTYVPEWLLGEQELKPAPDRITIKTSRKPVTTQVTYGLRDEGDGVLVPVGTATMSLNEYKATEKTGDRSRPRKLPELTHGIELVLVLTVDGLEAVRGTVGEQLEKRVNGYRGGKKRAQAVQAGEIWRKEAIQPGAVPPWGPAHVRWR